MPGRAALIYDGTFGMVDGGFQLAMGVPLDNVTFSMGKSTIVGWMMTGGIPMTKRKPPYRYQTLFFLYNCYVPLDGTRKVHNARRFGGGRTFQLSVRPLRKIRLIVSDPIAGVATFCAIWHPRILAGKSPKLIQGSTFKQS